MAGNYLNTYKSSFILFAKDGDPELIHLKNIFGLPDINKESIVRILGYLDRLGDDMSVYDALPDEIVLTILEKLDRQDIVLACDISDRFNKLCENGKILQLPRKKLEQDLRPCIESLKNIIQ